jgi:hypothetical protein
MGGEYVQGKSQSLRRGLSTFSRPSSFLNQDRMRGPRQVIGRQQGGEERVEDNLQEHARDGQQRGEKLVEGTELEQVYNQQEVDEEDEELHFPETRELIRVDDIVGENVDTVPTV